MKQLRMIGYLEEQAMNQAAARHSIRLHPGEPIILGDSLDELIGVPVPHFKGFCSS